MRNYRWVSEVDLEIFQQWLITIDMRTFSHNIINTNSFDIWSVEVSDDHNYGDKYIIISTQSIL